MKLKHLIYLLFGTGFSFTLQAQDNVVSSISLSEFQRSFSAFSEEPSLQSAMCQTVYNQEKYRKFKKMRTTGMVLTGVGAGLITTGIVLIASGADDIDLGLGAGSTDTGMTAADRRILGGIFCVVFGGLTTGGGITLWTIGNNKMKKYGNAINLQPAKNGFGLAYFFLGCG